MGFFKSLFEKRSKVGDIVHVYTEEELEAMDTDKNVPEKVEKLIDEVENEKDNYSDTSEDKEKIIEMTIPKTNEQPKVTVKSQNKDVKQVTDDIATFKNSSAVNIIYNDTPSKIKQKPLGSPEVDTSNKNKNNLRLLKIKKLISNIQNEKKNNISNLIKSKQK